MNLDTIFKMLPDGVLCRELKLLYVSGRLFEALEGRDLDKMPLTKIEKMFLKWAIKQWVKSEKEKLYVEGRKELKHWATKYAITGQDPESQHPYFPRTPNPTFSIPDQSYIPPSIRADVGEVGVAVSNTTGKTTYSEVFQTYEDYNRKRNSEKDNK
jgi:hypothetical protein